MARYQAEWADNPNLCHADGRMVSIGAKAADLIEREMRSGCEHLPEDAGLCHGCLLAISINTVAHLFKNHRHDDINPSEFMRNVAEGLDQFALTLALDSMIRGTDEHRRLEQVLQDVDRRAIQ